MIGVEEALKIIHSTTHHLDVVTINVEDSLGLTLSTDVISPINMPPFEQSAMDGYAINAKDTASARFEIIGKAKAGDNSSDSSLEPGQAFRVFTGAMLPKKCTAVIMQEFVDVQGDFIEVKKSIQPGENIRKEGEQIETGAKALKKGTILTPGSIGFLSSLGIIKVQVYRKPTIKILTTGNELVSPGTTLKKGEIYESNSSSLRAALSQFGFTSNAIKITDNYSETLEHIKSAIETNDLVLITGGISVGEYDFVRQSLQEIGVEELFYKVKQKPGKPLFFGRKENTLIFGLPGNPAAVLSCFYLYVLPVLYNLIGQDDVPLRQRELTLKEDYRKGSELTHFLKGYHEGEFVQILGAQSSAMLSSFVVANCIIKLEEGKEIWNKGDKCEAILLY